MAEILKKAIEANVQTGSSLFELNLNKNAYIKSLTPEQNLYLDPFDEDEAEQRFLQSKPSCFLVIGKPGVGKTTLAKKLAQEWKAELINPTDLIIQNVKNATELGIKAKEILIKGEAVPESLVAKMIDEKVNSPECAHHGYVLDGFPSQSDSNFDIGKQMEMLKNWKLQPDFILNLRISDEDLTKRRVTQKVDSISGNVYIQDIYAPSRSRYKNKPKLFKPFKKREAKKEENEEENEEEEAEEEAEENAEEAEEEIIDEFFAPIPADVVERLVVQPEDTLPQIESSIRLFKEALLHAFEDQMANMDQSFLLELDSNLSPTVLISQVVQRLHSYPVRKAPRALRLTEPPESTGEGEGEEEARGEEEQAPTDPYIDPAESEETLALLATKRRLAAQFKWRRSKCSYICPVTLYESGRIQSGRGEYAAAFLDKLYLMADEAALRKFLKNPRIYLKAPQPRAPCKVSVLGAKYSGKTSLCAILAKKYNARVIDMQALMEPQMKRAKEELIEKTKRETVESAIEQIRIKYRERIEQERIRKDLELAEKMATEAAAAETAQLQSQQNEGDKIQEDIEENIAEEVIAGEPNEEEDAEPKTPKSDENIKVEKVEEIKTVIVEDEPDQSSGEKLVYVNEEGEIIVDLDHPEIRLSVEKALEELNSQLISLPATEYIETLRGELDSIRKERIKIDPTSPSDGGWILDNFPNDSDQLRCMAEFNIMPDTFVILNDSSDDSTVLMNRWYADNKQDIDEKIARRLAEEEALRLEELRKEEKLKEARRLEMERFNKELEQDPDTVVENKDDLEENKEEEAKKSDSDEASSQEENAESGDQNELNLKREALEKIVEEDESKDHSLNKKDQQSQQQQHQLTVPIVNQSQSSLATTTSVEPGTTASNLLPQKGPETHEFLESVKKTSEQLKIIQTQVISLTGQESALLDINKKSSTTDNEDEEKSLEECCLEAATTMEKIFKIQPIDYDGTGEEEEGEMEESTEEDSSEHHLPELDDNDDDDSDNEEEEEEDDLKFDPVSNESKLQFGSTCHYCPVSLKNRNILVPGSLEFQCKYRDRVFRFTSDEARQQFITTPEAYLPTKSKPLLDIPAPRILILGSRGSGKSTQARMLAEKMDIFHIKFRDYLQEMIVGKVKKKIEPEKEEDRELIEDDEEVDPDEDEELKENKPVKIEETLPELNEKEETIKAYLERDELLSTDILDEVLLQFWNEEPFKSRGFILDGFPNNESQAQYLIEKGLYPDAVVILKLDDDVVIKRLLVPRMLVWREKMNAKKTRKMARIAKKKEKLAKKMKERRNEEISKFEERRRIREEEAAENDEEAEEEEFDVDAIIQEEFADQLQEEEEADEVQEDEIKENMINDLRNHFENQTNSIDLAKDILQEFLIPRFTIEANRKPNIVNYLIRKKLKKFIDFRQSLFERVYPIKNRLANKLIDFGYKHLSRFGRWCPVKLLKNDPTLPLYNQSKHPYACIHRSYIYFLSSKSALKLFLSDPLHYLAQPSPLPLVPLRLSILGPPKSGKSTLANRLCAEFGCVRLSAGEAIRNILKNQPYCQLTEKIKSHLLRGKAVPDELVIECIELCILDVQCQIRGYVLDGYPITKNQVKLMTERALIPVKVIELKCDVKEVMHRCVRDRVARDSMAMTWQGSSANKSGKGKGKKREKVVLHDSPEVIGFKLKEWKQNIGFIRDWYKNEHKCLVELDAHQSKWLLWDQTRELGFDSIRHIQTYLYRISQQMAASIAQLCVTYEEMCSRLGDFGQYCPVSLALANELVDCSHIRHMDFVAEYQAYYYKMYSERELELFLADPSAYVAPKAPRKLPAPNLLPKKRTPEQVKELFPAPIELQGYCPVTYYDGKLRYEAIEPGLPEYAAEYKGKLYFMASEDKLEKFMRRPDLYAGLKLAHKLPPVKSPMNLFQLPMTGYLEQTVADLLIKSLTELGNYKPKFPFLSPTKSALLYLAYNLKASNPKSSEFRRKKYKQKLAYFEQKCELINYLYKNTTIKYKSVTKRSSEYNVKLENFFALKENIPTMNWLS